VHPTGGSRRVFKQFSWLQVGSGKAALSHPTHQRVTPAVGCFAKSQHAKINTGDIAVRYAVDPEKNLASDL